jgi:starch-binding outer membrane protein, SusD/RagB family
MFQKNNLLFVLIFSLPCLISCKKYLNKQSNTSYVVPGTLNDLQGLMDDAMLMNVHSTPSYGEASSDNYFLPPDTYNSLREQLQDTYTWIPHDYYASNDWSSGYLPVYNSNYCLEALSNIPVNPSNQAEWRNVKGSALFFRAYYFLQLAWVYCKAYDENTAKSDLGIVLRLGSDFNVKSERSTVKETYERVLSDVKESVDYLSDLPIHPYRPSKAAAYGLLARTYLSMRQYDSALKYSGLCLNIDSTLLDYNDPGINRTANVPFQPFNPEIIFYSSMNTFNLTIAPVTSRVDTTLYNSYDSADLRKTIFTRLSSGYQRFKGSYSASVSELFSGIATDEMYLVRAECYARVNDIDNALSDLNTLMRKRWNNIIPYNDITASSSDEALKRILIERRKELLYRGLRWIDIKRLNKEGANIIVQRNINGNVISLLPNDNRYALPLPKDIINEAGIQQNPQ